MAIDLEQLRRHIEYFRELGIHDLYRRGLPAPESEFAKQVASARSVLPERLSAARTKPKSTAASEEGAAPASRPAAASRPSSGGARPSPAAAPVLRPNAAAVTPVVSARTEEPHGVESPIGKLISLDEVIPARGAAVALAERSAALVAVRKEIGDCTRCPLAYAGRHTIVFGEGDSGARLMFVGEGPGADEDASGRPFVGKAGQLLNNMILAMGLQREQVYIANIVKCRPPGNRVPEPVEANTCTPFLAQQMDIVGPQVVVALGLTAAMYLLGVRQSLSSLRGQWHEVRGAKVAVTYHPAYLLRDPRQKGEAWKDLQRVMTELKLRPPASVAAAKA